MKKNKESKKISQIFPFFIIFMSMVFGITCANIGNITGTIEVTAESPLQDEVFISDAEYYSDVDADTTSSKINTYSKRMLSNTVVLSKTNGNSSITYKIKLYNSTNYVYEFTGLSWLEEFFDNNNITAEISSEGAQIGDYLQPKVETEVYVIFKYKTGQASSQNELNSYINFDVKIPAPKVTVNPESATKCKNVDVTITVEDISKYGLSVNNSYQYYLSTDGTTPTGGTWKNYTSGVAQTIGTGLTGNYYLFVKQVFDTINNGSEITNNGSYHIYGTYIFSNAGTLVNTIREYNDTSTFLGGGKDKTITRDKIERVNLITDIGEHTLEDEKCWDVSKEKNGSILAWYEDIDNDGLYEVTIATDGERIKANSLSNYLFANIGKNSKCDDKICINGLENLDVSKVTNMSYMFGYCGYTAMTSLTLPESFDTSKVTNMSYMFQNCGYTAMTKLALPESFNTQNVINMSGMFYCCGYTAMIELTLPENFDTSNVTDMRFMFYNCGYTAMTSLILPKSFDTAKVTNMYYMFSYCGNTAMIKLVLPESFNTQNVINMSGMFYCCGYTAMTKLILPESFNTASVTDMSLMFAECGYTAMTSLILPESFNTANVVDMSRMFESCGYKSMTEFELPENFDTSKVENMERMFRDLGNKVMTKLSLPRKFDTSKVTSMKEMFSSCGQNAMTSLTLPESFNTSNVTDMSYMFNICGREKMTSLILSENFNTSNVTNMTYMFANCGEQNMTELNLPNTFNTSNVTNMSSMFSGEKKLTKLILPESFDTSNVTDMKGMFWGCSNITELDLTKFNTSKVTNMSNMLSMGKIEKIYVSEYNENTDKGWTTKNVTNSTGMFLGCNEIVGGNGTKYNSNYTDATYAVIDTDSTPGYFTKR